MTAFEPEGLRPYRPEDLPTVLSFTGECNARAAGCGYQHPGDVVHLMSNALRGRELDRHIHLYETPDGVLQALVLIYPARSSGYDLLVSPDLRGGTLEQGLIEWAGHATEALLEEAGSEATSLGADVVDCDTVRRDLLLRLGYTAPAAPSLIYTMRSLDDPIPVSALPDGFSIRSVAGEHEVEAVAAVHDSAFTPKWAGGAYLPVMRTPGFDIERELVVVAPDGRFAAFLVYWLDPISRSGLFEPVGCHADFRRRGLTQALMYEGMRRMVERGMRSAIVLHEADNPASTALYHSVGFRPTYTISEYRKPLAAGSPTPKED